MEKNTYTITCHDREGNAQAGEIYTTELVAVIWGHVYATTWPFVEITTEITTEHGEVTDYIWLNWPENVIC